MQILQNCAMKIILKCLSYANVERMLREIIRWMSLENILDMKGLFSFKIKWRIMSLYFNDFIQTFEKIHILDIHDTRKKMKFYIAT